MTNLHNALGKHLLHFLLIYVRAPEYFPFVNIILLNIYIRHLAHYFYWLVHTHL